jgi:hypothetical protein
MSSHWTAFPRIIYPEEQTKDKFFFGIRFESGKWQSVKGASIPLSGYYMHGSQVGKGRR